jgi:hypothetical protein
VAEAAIPFVLEGVLMIVLREDGKLELSLGLVVEKGYLKSAGRVEEAGEHVANEIGPVLVRVHAHVLLVLVPSFLLVPALGPVVVVPRPPFVSASAA